MRVPALFTFFSFLLALCGVDCVEIEGRILQDSATVAKGVYVNNRLVAYTDSTNKFRINLSLLRLNHGTIRIDSPPIRVNSTSATGVVRGKLVKRAYEMYQFRRLKDRSVSIRKISPGILFVEDGSSTGPSSTNEAMPVYFIDIKPIAGGDVPVLTTRESFNIMSLLSNPMAIMMVVSLVLMVAMQLINPEELKEEARKAQLSQQQQPKIAEIRQ